MDNRLPRFMLALALAALIGALTLLATTAGEPPAALALATTHYVAPGGSCGGMTPCYATVQAAVDAASPGDTIKVAAGTYTGVQARAGLNQAVYITKSLTILGGYTTANWNVADPAANVATLNANGQGRVVYIAGAISVTIDGLRLTGGKAAGLGGGPAGLDAGGGVYVTTATVTLSRNTVDANVAGAGWDATGYGGGVYLDHSQAAILSNTIANNTAAASTGGMFSMSDGYGGGLYAEACTVTVQANRITGNTGGQGGALINAGDGGGLYLGLSRATVTANVIQNNKATDLTGMSYGGGVALFGCQDFTFINNLVADNRASYAGSGVWIGRDDTTAITSTGRLLHTTVARNQGLADVAGVQVGDSIGDGSAITLTNTILVGHDTGIGVISGSQAILTATLWGSGVWANNTDWEGEGTIITGALNYWGDPAFLNPGAGNYHISSSSAAKDRGVNAGVTADLDGNPRSAPPDLGAYEAGTAGALQVVKSASANLLNPGDMVTYTIVVTNAGLGGMTNVVLVDNLPALQHPLSAATDKGTYTINNAGYGGRVTFHIGGLSGGQAAHLTIVAQVNATVPASLPQTMRNTAQATSDQAASPTTVYADTILQNCRACVNGGATRYSTVQAAVDAAPAGSAVWIAGTCVGAFERAGLVQQVYLNKNLTLRGGYSLDFAVRNPDLYTTTLHANGRGRVVYVAGPASVTLETLTLTGGDATGLGGAATADDMGGGLCARNASVTLLQTQVVSNVASTQFSGYGGGVGTITTTLTLADTTLARNTASRASLGLGFGGGLFAESSAVQLTRSRLTDNVAAESLAGSGGGAYLHECHLVGDAALWLANSASLTPWGEGGGLYVSGSQPFTLTNCVLADNRADDGGSGLYLSGAAGVILHPTIARNQGGAGVSLNVTSTVAITNAIVFSHTVGLRATEGSVAIVRGVLWASNVTNTIAVTATVQVSEAVAGAPAFLADGYHIPATSAARDAGLVSRVPTDIDGDRRPFGPAYDLGADECVAPYRLYLPLVLRQYP